MIVVLHKTQVLCYPALLNIVLLIVFTLFTVPSSKALLVVCVNSRLYRTLSAVMLYANPTRLLLADFSASRFDENEP